MFLYSAILIGNSLTHILKGPHRKVANREGGSVLTQPSPLQRTQTATGDQEEKVGSCLTPHSYHSPSPGPDTLGLGGFNRILAISLPPFSCCFFLRPDKIAAMLPLPGMWLLPKSLPWSLPVTTKQPSSSCRLTPPPVFIQPHLSHSPYPACHSCQHAPATPLYTLHTRPHFFLGFIEI